MPAGRVRQLGIASATVTLPLVTTPGAEGTPLNEVKNMLIRQGTNNEKSIDDSILPVIFSDYVSSTSLFAYKGLSSLLVSMIG